MIRRTDAFLRVYYAVAQHKHLLENMSLASFMCLQTLFMILPMFKVWGEEGFKCNTCAHSTWSLLPKYDTILHTHIQEGFLCKFNWGLSNHHTD